MRQDLYTLFCSYYLSLAMHRLLKRILLPALILPGLIVAFSCSRNPKTAAETELCAEKHQLTAEQEKEIRKAIHADEKSYRLDTLFKKKFGRQGFNGAVLVAQKGIILYENAQGYSNLKDKTPLTLNSAFQLASISKTFTGVATLLLVQEGKLSLSDTVRQFFPKFPYPGVTILDLLSHRSGLPNYLYAFEEKRKLNAALPTNDSVMAWFCQADPPVPPYNKPGCFFSYNNSNFIILASIIEKVSGMSYPEFLRKRIFLPLRMFHTFVDTLAPDSLRINQTTGHQGNRIREREFFDGVYGDKGIFSSAADLSRWYFGLMNECILNRHWLKQAFTPRSFEKHSRHNYGLGFRLMCSPTDMKKVEYVYHGGWWAGYSTMFWSDPEEEFVIIILSNKKSNAAYEIRPILDILEDGKSTKSKEEDGISDSL